MYEPIRTLMKSIYARMDENELVTVDVVRQILQAANVQVPPTTNYKPGEIQASPFKPDVQMPDEVDDSRKVENPCAKFVMAVDGGCVNCIFNESEHRDPDTVEVRIAVWLDSSGNIGAWHCDFAPECRTPMCDGELAAAIITARVPIPKAIEIEGVVE